MHDYLVLNVRGVGALEVPTSTLGSSNVPFSTYGEAVTPGISTQCNMLQASLSFIGEPTVCQHAVHSPSWTSASQGFTKRHTYFDGSQLKTLPWTTAWNGTDMCIKSELRTSISSQALI